MLRLLVLLLLLANVGYFAWSRGTLAAYGFAPAVQSEPQRLAQQLRPEAMHILTSLEVRELEMALEFAAQAPTAAPASAPVAPLTPTSSGTASSSMPASASGATPAASAVPASSASASVSGVNPTPTAVANQCLQSGLFNDDQTAVLRVRLQSALPPDTWVLESRVEPARWMIYMGRYANSDVLVKKRSELRQLNVSFEPLNNLALEPGLSLGNFNSQLDADTELVRIAKRGVKTAKVIQAQPELRGQMLKLAAVTPALRTQLETIKPLLDGKPLQTCR